MNANEIQQHVQQALAAQALAMEAHINAAISRGLESAARQQASAASSAQREPKLDLPPFFDSFPTRRDLVNVFPCVIVQ